MVVESTESARLSALTADMTERGGASGEDGRKERDGSSVSPPVPETSTAAIAGLRGTWVLSVLWSSVAVSGVDAAIAVCGGVSVVVVMVVV